MAGPLDGVKVVDLSWGIAGPMASMLLADQGALVTRIERPGGTAFDDFAGTRVWSRGKRSAVLDLDDPDDRATFLALVDDADVLLESFTPGVTGRLGIDFATLTARNPRLVYCSITGYGRDNPHEQRPGYEALVAARTGSQYAQRGGIMSSTDFDLPPVEIPEGAEQGARPDGPIFTSSPWLSITACYQATMGIVAALFAREATGLGQWVEASLAPPRQVTPEEAARDDARANDPNSSRAPIAGSWMQMRGAPKGLFECADGRWVHQWALKPLTIIQAAEYGKLEDAPAADYASRMQDPNRIGMEPEAIVEIFYYFPLMVEAFKKFTADEWVAWGARVKEGVQPIRAPEEALEDPWCLEDGCVVEVQDPELGPIRHVGILQDFARTPGRVQGPAPRRGEHTDAVREEARATAPRTPATPEVPRTIARPLEGIRVLDLGVALAGPFANVQLANLGADVIKVNAPHDSWWLHTAMGQSANLGKRSVVLDLKTPRGIELLHELVKTADVVAHNMRYGTPEKLGIDDESLRAVNPDIVYCQSFGFDRTRSAMRLPGTDQAGSALAGQEWEDGGCSDGGRPFFGTSMGDLGNGYLSAISIVEALYHRARTGEGQKVGTAIMKACLLTSSSAFVDAEGTPAPRPRLDAMQLGLTALYRLYETSDGWLCLACLTDAHWAGLGPAIGRPELVADTRFATAGKRTVHDGALGRILEGVFAARPASDWRELLDDHGVPAEVSTNVFRDGLVGPVVGLSATPARVPGPAPRLGQHSREILASIGVSDAEFDDLVAAGISVDGAPAAGV